MQVVSINQDDTLYHVCVHHDNGTTDMIPIEVSAFEHVGPSAHHFKVVPRMLGTLIQTIEALSTKGMKPKRPISGLPKHPNPPKKPKLDENVVEEQASSNLKNKNEDAAIKWDKYQIKLEKRSVSNQQTLCSLQQTDDETSRRQV